jgi:hypothetical protein
VLRCALTLPALAQTAPVSLSFDWSKVVITSKSSVSIQVCVEPPLRRGYPIHDQLFSALRSLKADYARLAFWYQYPNMAVAELRAPAGGHTYWDFTLMDQITVDFMNAAEGRPVALDFSTIPSWMVKTKLPDVIPENPDERTTNYGVNREFTEFHSTIKSYAAYQARLASWYTKGGFSDEYGKWHASGHYYRNIAYWEILNEPDIEERALTAAQYTQLYDAVVEAVRKVNPQLKFMGPAASDSVGDEYHQNALPEYFLYFLDPKNHKPGIPIDAVSYHFYVIPDPDETPDVMQYTFFDLADKFLSSVRYIELVRRRFSPRTKTAIDELGSILLVGGHDAIFKSYWSLSGAAWAYLYGELAPLGIDMIHGAELIDYPGQVASATLVDWGTGVPNARYWVLKLLRENFGPGDSIVASPKIEAGPPGVYSQGFITREGKRRILLVNKRDHPIEVSLAGVAGGYVQMVDQTTTASAEIRKQSSDSITLPGWAVAVVGLPR